MKQIQLQAFPGDESNQIRPATSTRFESFLARQNDGDSDHLGVSVPMSDLRHSGQGQGGFQGHAG
ncbi:MAG: hypothetical protein WBM14_10020 [Terracidiphilus sp.]